MSKHSFAQVDGTRGAAERGGDNEAKDVQERTNDQGLEDVVAAGRPVGVWRDEVRNESNREEERSGARC